MSDQTIKDIYRISNSFISDLNYLQERLESLAKDELDSEMLEYGAHGCINMFGVSETLKIKIEQYRGYIEELEKGE